MNLLNNVLQSLLPLTASALAIILIYYIGRLIKAGQDKSDSAMVDKYLGMLDTAITNAVLATTQTYVEAMKAKNLFDKDAQKKAFDMTYNAVMQVLTDEAKRYIESVVGDLNVYITNQIEATVKLTKQSN